MKPTLLDLFCGAGGAAMGYHRAGFEILGVDIRPQPHFPFELVQADALEYTSRHGHDFDVIHASPPCQRYSHLTPRDHKKRHPDLIEQVRRSLQATARPFVIENVPGARRLLRAPVMLCGSMFGLQVRRHRYFEVSPAIILLTPTCRHDYKAVYISGSTGSANSPTWFRRRDFSKSEKAAAIGIDWMTTTELDQAIPPAYTEWLGQHLIEALFP